MDNFCRYKDIVSREMDEVFAGYGEIPPELFDIACDDTLSLKRALIARMVEICPVYPLMHYPFAYLVSTGQKRTQWHGGGGGLTMKASGVDRSALDAFIARGYREHIHYNNDFRDYYHRALNYDRVLAIGLSGLLAEIEKYNDGETDSDKAVYRKALGDVLLALKRLSDRFALSAREMEAAAPDAFSRMCMLRLAIACVRVPWLPSESFFEAIQTLMFLYEAVNAMDGVAVNSYGMVDRLLEPYYQRDIHNGRLTTEEAYELICFFLYAVDGRFRPIQGEELETACTVVIGGQDAQGEPVFGEVTRLILRAYREQRYVSPKLNARVCGASPEEYLRLLAETILSGVNNIAILNDRTHVKLLSNMGLDVRDSRMYIGGGCQEILAAGTQSHSRAFSYANMPGVLLDTLNHTRAELYGGALQTRVDTFEGLYASFLGNLRALLSVAAQTFAPYDRLAYQINPELIYSLFLDDCAQKGRDAANMGARYNHTTFSLVGFGTVLDSLLSLKRVVYERGEATLNEVKKALERNFKGERDCVLCANLSDSSFAYGSGTDESEAFAKRFAQDLSVLTQGMENGQGVKWNTSLFAYYLFEKQAAHTGATPNGRQAGEPFTRGLGPSDVVVGEQGLTAAALAARFASNAPFGDTAVLDLTLDATRSIQSDALVSYIHGCEQLGVPSLQMNVVSLNDMLEEKMRPGTHPSLVVRVCGFSARFSSLSPSVQDEIISRLRMEA